MHPRCAGTETQVVFVGEGRRIAEESGYVGQGWGCDIGKGITCCGFFPGAWGLREARRGDADKACGFNGLKTAEFHGIKLGVNLARDDYGVRKKPSINRHDPAEKAHLIESLVKDRRSLVEAVERVRGAPDKLREAAELLTAVIEQDIEEGDDGARIREGVARDRVISVVDPEVR